ncbi:respiratory nitrate reductase subunit gamma [Saccharothrix deserti]|uniref:respiratory nitrate reductase subunit gamma n=1 Tax=Saccharothrix deserti TaxID=2593674 RepID=UPI001EE4968B
MGAGAATAVMLVVGLGLLARRFTNARVRRATTATDKVLFAVLTVAIAVWFRGLFWLRPDPTLMIDVPLVFQLHALSAFALFAVWPFTRLVHSGRPVPRPGTVRSTRGPSRHDATAAGARSARRRSPRGLFRRERSALARSVTTQTSTAVTST